MTIHQLSVFIENKSGTLLKVLTLLKEANIQLIASTISDTVEYGIYRIICSEPQRAYDTLKMPEYRPASLMCLPSRWIILRDVLPTPSSSSAMPESAYLIFILSCWAGKVFWYSGQTIRTRHVRLFWKNSLDTSKRKIWTSFPDSRRTFIRNGKTGVCS